MKILWASQILAVIAVVTAAYAHNLTWWRIGLLGLTFGVCYFLGYVRSHFEESRHDDI